MFILRKEWLPTLHKQGFEYSSLVDDISYSLCMMVSHLLNYTLEGSIHLANHLQSFKSKC